jgi:MoxR-like ATPase
MRPEERDSVPQLVEHLLDRAERVVQGQRDSLELVVLAVLCGGHVLLEGVPGTAKTLMARTLARLLRLDCKRVQFTPDLMPSDVVGTNVFNMQTSRFEFRAGPVFTDILVADEINRTPPKTQSALLEVMEEKTVTIDGVSHPLSDVFTVYRFLIKLNVTHPAPEEEDRILRLYQGRAGLGHPLDILGTEDGATVTREELQRARQQVAMVNARPEVCTYVGNIVRQTRELDRVMMGASSRAAVHLIQAAKVKALMAGRTFVSPDDVKMVCRPVLRHRIMLQPDAIVEGQTTDEVLSIVLERVEVPR